MVQPLRQLLAVSVWVTSSASLPLSPLVRGHLEVATPRRTCRWLIALQGSVQRHMAVHLPIRLPIPASGAPLFLQSSSAGLLRLFTQPPPLRSARLPVCLSAIHVFRSHGAWPLRRLHVSEQVTGVLGGKKTKKAFHLRLFSLAGVTLQSRLLRKPNVLSQSYKWHLPRIWLRL